jgi:hypothetical protein
MGGCGSLGSGVAGSVKAGGLGRRWLLLGNDRGDEPLLHRVPPQTPIAKDNPKTGGTLLPGCRAWEISPGVTGS